jgi:phosphoglycolate phosphatase-like HAD superfamily hydrolase
VQCGQSLGVRPIGVATGHYSVGDLMACGAYAAFEDLSDTAAVMDAIYR